MGLNFNTRDPVYLQVVRYFKEQISIGEYEPGQEIPSRRELANQLSINPNTAQRAYKEMEDEGLIFTEGNLPSRVTKDVVVIEKVRRELIVNAVEKFLDSVQAVHVPLDEILTLIEERYKESEGNSE